MSPCRRAHRAQQDKESAKRSEGLAERCVWEQKAVNNSSEARLNFFPAADLVKVSFRSDRSSLCDVPSPEAAVTLGVPSSDHGTGGCVLPQNMLVRQGMRLALAACPDPASRWMLSRPSATSNGSWCNPLPNNRRFACYSKGTRCPLDALCLTVPGPASLKRHTGLLCLIGLPRRTRSIRLCAAVASRGVAFSRTLCRAALSEGLKS